MAAILDLRAGISALALCYVAGILPQTSVWALGMMPLPPKKWSGRGRPPKLIRRDDRHQPLSVKQIALGLPKRAWRTIKWREGTSERLSSRFARMRVRVAHRDYNLTGIRPERRLLIEWPKGEDEPSNYWLSTLPPDIAFRSLVNITKLRWRIERDYQELEREDRARTFRRARMARISSPRHAVHSSLRIPDLREGEDSPLWTSFHHVVKKLAVPDGYRPRGCSPLRPERHIPNSVATMRRRLIIAMVRILSRCPCCATQIRRPPSRVVHDAVD